MMYKCDNAHIVRRYMSLTLTKGVYYKTAQILFIIYSIKSIFYVLFKKLFAYENTPIKDPRFIVNIVQIMGLDKSKKFIQSVPIAFRSNEDLSFGYKSRYLGWPKRY